MTTPTPTLPPRRPGSPTQLQDMPVVATARGARPGQEDRFLILRVQRKRHGHVHEHGWLLAIMDGHGGPEAAQAVEQKLPKVFHQAFKAHHGDMRRALERAITMLDEEPQVRYQLAAGTTLSIAYIADDKATVHVAHLGDSPVIIFDKAGRMLFRTEEHNIITNPREIDRARRRSIERHGEDRIKLAERITPDGRREPRYIKDRHMEEDFEEMLNEILDQIEEGREATGEDYTLDEMERDSQMLARIMKARGIQNTAQLGGFPFDAILSREPDITEVPVLPDQLPVYVLLATDGILDVLPGASVQEVEGHIAHAIAVERLTPAQLIEKVGGEKAPDNTTILLHKITRVQAAVPL